MELLAGRLRLGRILTVEAGREDLSRRLDQPPAGPRRCPADDEPLVGGDADQRLVVPPPPRIQGAVRPERRTLAGEWDAEIRPMCMESPRRRPVSSAPAGGARTVPRAGSGRLALAASPGWRRSAAAVLPRPRRRGPSR